MSLRLETKRLILRPFRESDLESFAAYRSDPQVALYQGWDTPFSLGKARAFIGDMMKRRPGTPGEWYQIAIETRDSQEMIGDCVFQILANEPRQSYIGYSLARACWGNGYATEAVSRMLDYLFHDMKLHRVLALCDVENSPSICLLERLGFRREAHFIENIWLKNHWGSEYLYAILDREWAKA